ncbi:MAG: hypothetical protein LUC93_11560 [Planctomycetaceae bacterium]|nr:hypothetical protein [Planctomycetaceae bacterium]
MKRLSFLVNRGENDCFMVHGLDWAAYVEGRDWSEITTTILSDVGRIFADDAKPEFLDFKFPDGTIISMVA